MAKQAPTANQAVATPSAKPGTVDAAAKKPSRGRYVVPEGGLTAIPEDFDPRKYLPLRAKDFKDEALWCEVQAQRFDKIAAGWRKKATDAGKLGNVKDRAKAKTLIRMQDRMAALLADLKAQGVDTDALMAAAKKDAPAPAEVAAPATAS
jgi:hypothetical protein